jgi:hypothetical protein
MNQTNGPDMTPNPSPENTNLARRKINQAFELMREYSALASKGGVTLSFSNADPNSEPTDGENPAHAPSRFPDKPLPKPDRLLLSPSGKPLDPLYLEVEQRKAAAQEWCNRVSHQPNLGDLPSGSVQWGLFLHLSECVSNYSAAHCDCGIIHLVQVSGKFFSISADGSLTNIGEPKGQVNAFLANDFKYFNGLAGSIEKLAPHIWIKSYEFIELDGDFEEGPAEYKASKPIETHE